MARDVLILGGAGFIGSILVEEFVRAGWSVTVLDGVLADSGGDRANLSSVPGVRFLETRIEECAELPTLLGRQRLVVDCMGITSHVLGMKDPLYDLQLNCVSHLHLITALPRENPPRVIYLGSRAQYGSPDGARTTERRKCSPNDAQGVSKMAAEGYFRVYAAAYKWGVTSLRIANCFGEHQRSVGSDLGLVGNFVRDLIEGGQIAVYGHDRRRALVYVRDLARVILQLAHMEQNGFRIYNVAGTTITLDELAARLIKIIGAGRIVGGELPEKLRAFESTTIFDDRKLRRALPLFSYAPLDESLRRAVKWFRKGRR